MFYMQRYVNKKRRLKVSKHYPELDALATQYNEAFLVHDLTLNSTDERSGGLYLFMPNHRQDEEDQQK